MFRLPFRLTPLSAAQLAAALILTLLGLIFILGTTDEYRARRAFNRAMDSYSAGDIGDARDALEDAWQAKPAYDAPREVFGKLLVDDGARDPKNFDEARAEFQRLRQRAEAAGRSPSLPVTVGLAVAELEAVRAAKPTPDALAAALRVARQRLEALLQAHPNSGDLHVNLATIALLERDLSRCKAELDKVTDAGTISPAALPIVYNLNGLVALAEKRFAAALAEFEKVEEFAPNWDVPRLNLGATHAQMLMAGEANVFQAERSATALRRTLDRLRKSKDPLCGRISQALAMHAIRRNLPEEAIRRFGEAEAIEKLPWQSRFNRAVAQYMLAMAARARRPEALAQPAAELAQALTNPQASPRDRFLASCILGTIEAERKRPKEAIEHFQRAAAYSGPPDTFVRAALPTIHMSLIALYCNTGEYAKIAHHLEQAKATTDEVEKKKLDAFLSLIKRPPAITKFDAKLEKLYSDGDLSVSASLAVPSSPKVLGPDNVALSLVETASGLSKPIPFGLNGPQLYARALNLPQGTYRVELTLSDLFGGQDKATSEALVVDRDPPHVLNCRPEPNSTVSSVPAIQFEVKDTMSGVEADSLRVLLRYPGTAMISRALVSGGKYQFASADGATPRYAPVALPRITAPVPAERLVKGEYRVTVHVQDSCGKARDFEWSFTLGQ